MVARTAQDDHRSMLPVLRRSGLDMAYLTLALLTSVIAFAVWVTALSVTLSLAVFIVGIPVAMGAAYVMRWTAELDRRNAALVFGRPVHGRYRDHRRATFLGRVRATLGDPQVWRDLAWLITHSVVGFVFGVVAITLVGTVLGLATAPLWYWSVPDGIELGIYNADTLPWALITSTLALPLGIITVYALRMMARFHASLVVELLGRR
jgi:Putative sensor